MVRLIFCKWEANINIHAVRHSTSYFKMSEVVSSFEFHGELDDVIVIFVQQCILPLSSRFCYQDNFM